MSPMAKTAVNIPPMIRAVLNMIAGKPSTPRSLRAFPVQRNQGAECMAREISEIEIMGATTPLSPAAFIKVRLEFGMGSGLLLLMLVCLDRLKCKMVLSV